MGISYNGDFLGTTPFYTVIRDPILRLCHRLIACSIAGRSQAPDKVTVKDLFYLKGMDVGSVNVPYLLARYLRLFAAGRKSEAHISEGLFVARLVLSLMILGPGWTWDQRGALAVAFTTTSSCQDYTLEVDISGVRQIFLRELTRYILEADQTEDWRGQHLHSSAGPTVA
ncbi:hypothetical protein Tco_1233814 [Tanacetum coccineum]